MKNVTGSKAKGLKRGRKVGTKNAAFQSDELMTIKQAADQLQVAKQTVVKYLKADGIKVFTLSERKHFINRVEFNQWLDNRYVVLPKGGRPRLNKG
jgi:excisionase family DNA binding protein